MNEPSLNNQAEQMNDPRTGGRARLRVAIFVVLGLHVALLSGLLILGCKREEPTPPVEQPAYTPPVFEPTNVPTVETSAPPVGPVVAEPVQTAPAQPPQEPTPSPTEYTVEAGDTFYSIGKKFGVSYLAIQSANPDVDPRRLKPGQKIVIPPAATPSPGTGASAATTPATAGQETIYVVKSGDTLTKIARQFGVTVNAIRRANNLTTDRIKVGNKLKIPARAAEPGTPASVTPAPITPAPAPQGVEPVPAQPTGGTQPVPGPAPAQ